jgi:hypothetical protein
VTIVTRLLNGLIVLTLTATPAATAEPTDFNIQRQFELPAHRALARARADSEGVPAPFTSDGCSGGLSSIWTIVSDRFPKFSKAHGEEPPWEKCCVIHDMAYHSAGASAAPEESFANRAIADQALRACVVETGKKRLSEIAELYGADEDTVGNAYRAIANAMYLAVRLGGAPCSGMPWRWGYGYPHCFVTPSDLVGR